ncbi:MAG: radical SAM protein [Sedimentisphaerales bacterium]|nr:radical SAM protein [Sedimentisphaerales bacterium]
MALLESCRQMIPESLKRHVPAILKHPVATRRAERLRRDLERFRREGRRFVPPLASFAPMVMVDVTARCNLRCSHCPHSVLSNEQHYAADMDRQLCLDLIEQVARQSPASLLRLFNSGEPLLCGHLDEYIAFAKRLGVRRVSITTNGTLLDAERRRALLDGGLDHLEVSIDAATPETFTQLKRTDHFETVVQNTLAFCAERRRRGSPCQVDVSFVWQAANRQELEPFRSFWQDKVDFIHIREIHCHNNLVDDRSAAPPPEMPHRHPCPYLWNRIIIHHDGRVRFCEADALCEHVVGDARRESLRAIWLGPAYQQLRRQHVEGTFDHPFCRRCSDWRIIKWDGL